jgi:hypothetical protein
MDETPDMPLRPQRGTLPVHIKKVVWDNGQAYGYFEARAPFDDEAGRMLEEALNDPDTPEQGMAMTVLLDEIKSVP